MTCDINEQNKRLHRELYKSHTMRQNGQKKRREEAQIRQSWRIQEKNKEKRANKRSLARNLLQYNCSFENQLKTS